MNRRQFLATVGGAISLRADVLAGQPFTAGIVPAGRSSTPGQMQGFWQHCDEVANLAFHQHLLLGRFLAAVGGKYITHMLAIDDVLNEPGDVAAYGAVDLTTWVKNANEIGCRLLNEHGIKLAYHPEQGEVRTELYKRFLASTDERFVYFLPDTGHIASGGADAVDVCRLYRSRLACVHLKDFAPVAADGKPVKADNVLFGAGAVHFAAMVAYLEKSNFTGHVNERRRRDESSYA